MYIPPGFATVTPYFSYGDRQGGVRDAWGNIWWISQRLVDGPYTS